MEQVVFHSNSKPERLDLFLARATGRSRSFVQALIRKGLVKVEGVAIEKASYSLPLNVRVEASLELEEKPLQLEPVSVELDILLEDEHLIVINKPPGWVTHPTPTYEGPTVVNFILGHCLTLKPDSFENRMRPGIVHRLDKGTSGVLLIAKTRAALEKLSHQFKERMVKKCYHAIVFGDPGEKGRIQSFIGRSSRDRKKFQSLEIGGKEAITDWRRLATKGTWSLIELHPLTGRTHQLRVHLSELGTGIIGDPTYRRGAKKGNLPFEIPDAPLLHARSLCFFHPVSGVPIEVVAEYSIAFQRALACL